MVKSIKFSMKKTTKTTSSKENLVILIQQRHLADKFKFNQKINRKC